MIRTITPQAMQQMERAFMESTGTPGLLLMEHAALRALDVLLEMIPGKKSHALQDVRVLFLCGGGNNGGDGMALARLWTHQGGQAEVWLTTPPEKRTGDAATNARALAPWEIPVRVLEGEAPDIPEDTDIIVDALFGTGLSRPVEGLAAGLIAKINQHGTPVLSLDIPSGIDGATGQVQGIAVEAARTIAFHRPKPGHYLLPGRAHAGRLTIADIGIPPQWDRLPGYIIEEPSDLRHTLHRRPLDAHKGSCGHVLLIAGSQGMAGAVAFAAMATLRTGAGLCTIACPESILPTLQGLIPEALAVPLPEQNGQLTAEAARDIEVLLPGKTCLALGPGLSRSPGVAAALAPAFLSPLPKVIDADALYALGEKPRLPENAIFTPHPGEMRRLASAANTEAITADPVGSAQAFIAGTDAILVLKGATTVVAQDTGGREDDISLNITGSPGMATGGSGDVLTGILAGLLAQNIYNRWDAARYGVLLHGMAGLLAAKEQGVHGMTARDIVRAVSQVLAWAEDKDGGNFPCTE